MYRLTEGERTLLQQAMHWKERTVMERNKIIFRKKPTADQVKHMNETVGNIVQSKEDGVYGKLTVYFMLHKLT